MPQALNDEQLLCLKLVNQRISEICWQEEQLIHRKIIKTTGMKVWNEVEKL